MDANAARIADASTTARQALSAASKAAASIGPVAEQIAAADGQMVQMRSEIANLSSQETKQGAQLTEVSQGLASFRFSQELQLESLTSRLATHEARFGLVDQEARSTRTWTRAAAAGAAVGIGIVASHTLGHGGR